MSDPSVGTAIGCERTVQIDGLSAEALSKAVRQAAVLNLQELLDQGVSPDSISHATSNAISHILVTCVGVKKAPAP